MANKIYQIQIGLKGSKPRIWRRIQIQPDLLLADFHKVIQTTMGWTNTHLHQFIKGRTFYSPQAPDDDWWDDMETVDYKKMKISDLLKKENDKIIYEYDFGDRWEHVILLDKILPVDKNTKYPVCLSGKNNGPPEDCGGVWGYAELLDVLKDPSHPQYKRSVEWLGEKFDPEYFDKEEVNEMLQESDYGCIDYF